MHTSEDVCSLFMPLTQGEARVTRERAELFAGELRPGMLRVSVPEERSQVVFASPVSLIELMVPSDMLRKAFEGAGYLWPAAPAKFKPLVKPSRVIAALADAFRVTPMLGPPRQEEYLEGLPQALLACLVETQQFTLAMAERRSIRSLDDRQLARCADFANARLGRRLRLEDWASTLDMSVCEFARAFRKRTRQSPYAWFLDRRIELTKELLRTRGMPLAEVALSAGFCSQSHFTESFRRRVGCSPTRWLQSLSALHGEAAALSPTMGLR